MGQHTAIKLALRNKALSVVIATTGSISLQAKSSSYLRTTGSFLDDGFFAGMEVAPSGFTKNDVSVITEVSALELKVRDTRSPQSAAVGRSLTVGAPSAIAYENIDFTPPDTRPYVEEEYLPVPGLLRGQTQHGTKEVRGIYIWRWYGLPDQGGESVSLCADALVELFAPGLQLSLSTGEVVRMRDDMLPYPSPITNESLSKRPVCSINIPIRLYTTT